MVGDKKVETQAMPEDDLKGMPDGVNTQAKYGATGGSDTGAPYPNPHTGKAESEKGNFGGSHGRHGGQSERAYYGSGQLGSKEVERGGNQNAGAKGD